MTIKLRLALAQQIVEVEPVREHRQRTVRLPRPLRTGLPEQLKPFGIFQRA
jgi:hypothetical protein